MKIKASIHLHTKEDICDNKIVKYSAFELIDHVKKHNFQVLAITNHKYLFEDKKLSRYAKDKGLLLINGIELSLDENLFSKSHVIVLNCKQDIESVKTLEDLAKYKKSNPEIFIMAPHPSFDLLNSINKKNLEKYISLFDAIEHSFFYTEYFNLNKQNEKIAKKFDKPFISTSDAHTLDYIATDYILIELKELSIKSFFNAIRNQKFKNHSNPKKMTELLKHIWVLTSSKI